MTAPTIVSNNPDQATLTLDHEWPLAERVDRYFNEEPVVTLEVDTETGTGVIPMTYRDMLELIESLDFYMTYYDEVEMTRWTRS